MRNSIRWYRAVLLAMGVMFAVIAITSAFITVAGQTIGFERERGRQMLSVIKEDIKKNYYDPKFHGIDLDARFKAAEEKIKQANSVGQVQAIIAQVLVDFNDSHLYFLPPQKASRTDYGWQMQMIGDKPYIVAVEPGSDAAASGLKPGDEIYSLDGYEPTRENLWRMQYFYRLLRPKPAVRFIIQKADGQQRQIDVKAKVTEGRRLRGQMVNDIAQLIRESEDDGRLHSHKFYEAGDDLLVWKMPEFDLSEGEVDSVMDRARKHKTLVLDLRGNGGGLESTLVRLIGNVFDHELKVGDDHRRKETKPLIARTRGGDKVFKGRLVVLVDSNSASSSEIFARVIQLEKRGTIIGDRTAGAVMSAIHYPHESGTDIVAFYAVSVTFADLIMTDGKSLEKTGVVPDELMLPTSADLAAQRDPVLSRAAAIGRVKLDPEKAGVLFPIEWKK